MSHIWPHLFYLSVCSVPRRLSPTAYGLALLWRRSLFNTGRAMTEVGQVRSLLFSFLSHHHQGLPPQLNLLCSRRYAVSTSLRARSPLHETPSSLHEAPSPLHEALVESLEHFAREIPAVEALTAVV